MSFVAYDLTFLAIFTIFVVVFLSIKRKNLQRQGIMYLYRTKVGINFIEKFTKSDMHPKYINQHHSTISLKLIRLIEAMRAKEPKNRLDDRQTLEQLEEIIETNSYETRQPVSRPDSTNELRIRYDRVDLAKKLRAAVAPALKLRLEYQLFDDELAKIEKNMEEVS